MFENTQRELEGLLSNYKQIHLENLKLKEYNERCINYIKKTTDLCNTFCCYENCEECVEKFLKYIKNK